MQNVKDSLFKVINYFHKDDTYNRVTFGLDRNSKLKALIRWRYADVLLLVALFFSYILTNRITPFQRQFFINDLTISHPFAEHERVTNTQLFFYCTWVPACTIFIISLIFTKPANKVYVTFISIIGHLISVFTTSVVTDILKNFIGRHRPDFLARCVPKEGSPTDIMVFAKDVCTTTNIDRLMDGFRTTPSGHSSLSFAGLAYLSLWLSGQLIIKHDNLGAWRSIVAWIPCFGAALIALSRTEDYRHHFVDVIIGSILGFLIANWSYFRYFPALSKEKAYEPKIIIAEENEDEIRYNSLDILEEV